jgi:hypothetical protein
MHYVAAIAAYFSAMYAVNTTTAVTSTSLVVEQVLLVAPEHCAAMMPATLSGHIEILRLLSWST